MHVPFTKRRPTILTELKLSQLLQTKIFNKQIRKAVLSVYPNNFDGGS